MYIGNDIVALSFNLNVYTSQASVMVDVHVMIAPLRVYNFII